MANENGNGISFILMLFDIYKHIFFEFFEKKFNSGVKMTGIRFMRYVLLGCNDI